MLSAGVPDARKSSCRLNQIGYGNARLRTGALQIDDGQSLRRVKNARDKGKSNCRRQGPPSLVLSYLWAPGTFRREC